MTPQQTYEPKTAPAQAAIAAGVVVSARCVDAMRAAAWRPQEAMANRLFLAVRHRPTASLEDASVR